MPKLRQREVPHAQLGRLLAGAAVVQDVGAEEIGVMIGCCGKTARSRLRNPGDLTVSELTRLGKRLGIPIDELRAAIRY
ncbi:MAG: hypothetical protein IKD61_00055 [Oscillospiraceae bacterium]|nr:hypothetical protein [Oscillospiraceae bacterium]